MIFRGNWHPLLVGTGYLQVNRRREVNKELSPQGSQVSILLWLNTPPTPTPMSVGKLSMSPNSLETNMRTHSSVRCMRWRDFYPETELLPTFTGGELCRSNMVVDSHGAPRQGRATNVRLKAPRRLLPLWLRYSSFCFSPDFRALQDFQVLIRLDCNARISEAFQMLRCWRRSHQ